MPEHSRKTKTVHVLFRTVHVHGGGKCSFPIAVFDGEESANAAAKELVEPLMNPSPEALAFIKKIGVAEVTNDVVSVPMFEKTGLILVRGGALPRG